MNPPFRMRSSDATRLKRAEDAALRAEERRMLATPRRYEPDDWPTPDVDIIELPKMVPPPGACQVCGCFHHGFVYFDEDDTFCTGLRPDDAS